MKVSCSLQTLTSTEDDNNSSLTNLTQSVWNEIKLRKVDPKLMDEQLKVQFALELNPNFVKFSGFSSENLLIKWKEQNPDKRLFDLELHEDSLIKGQLENQGHFMTELKWLKRAEIKLSIRFNCFSAQFMENPDMTFLLYAKIFNIRTSELVDTVCCQIKIQENKPKSVKLIHFDQIQLQEYNVPDSKISYYKWLSIVIVTNILRAFFIGCIFVNILDSYKYGFTKVRNFTNIVFIIPLVSSFYFNFRSWIRSIHCVWVLIVFVDDVFMVQIYLQNIPNSHKVFIYLNTFLFVTTFIPKDLIATIVYLISLAGIVIVKSFSL